MIVYLQVAKYILKQQVVSQIIINISNRIVFFCNQIINQMSSEDSTLSSLSVYHKLCRQYLPNYFDLLTKGFIKDSMYHHPLNRVIGIGEILLIQLWHSALSYDDVFSSMKAIILSNEILYKNQNKLIETLTHLPPIIELSSILEKEKRIDCLFYATPVIIGINTYIYISIFPFFVIIIIKRQI